LIQERDLQCSRVQVAQPAKKSLSNFDHVKGNHCG
jgi:hypothetical protein